MTYKKQILLEVLLWTFEKKLWSLFLARKRMGLFFLSRQGKAAVQKGRIHPKIRPSFSSLFVGFYNLISPKIPCFLW